MIVYVIAKGVKLKGSSFVDMPPSTKDPKHGHKTPTGYRSYCNSRYIMKSRTHLSILVIFNRMAWTVGLSVKEYITTTNEYHSGNLIISGL